MPPASRSRASTRGGKSSRRSQRLEQRLKLLGLDRLDMKVLVLRIGPTNRFGEVRGVRGRDFDAGFAREDLDLADRALRHVAATAQERDQPFGIGVLRATNVDREPHAVAGGLLRARLARQPLAIAVRTVRAFGCGFGGRYGATRGTTIVLDGDRPRHGRFAMMNGSRATLVVGSDGLDGTTLGRLAEVTLDGSYVTLDGSRVGPIDRTRERTRQVARPLGALIVAPHVAHRRRHCQLFARGPRLATDPNERGDELAGRHVLQQGRRDLCLLYTSD